MNKFALITIAALASISTKAAESATAIIPVSRLALIKKLFKVELSEVRERQLSDGHSIEVRFDEAQLPDLYEFLKDQNMISQKDTVESVICGSHTGNE